jgi:ATP-dependent RNA helicase RhlE
VRNSTATNVTQIVFEVGEGDKTGAVVQLIRERGLKQVLVFCNSKIGASRLAKQIEKAGIIAAAIHGDRTQSERMQALEAFKRNEIECLVATDVAARGLDIAELPAVINFDLPFSAEDYVHRIGRTGRAGASGDALSLCSPSERKQLADIEKLIKRPLDRGTLVVTVVPARGEHERPPRREGERPRAREEGEGGVRRERARFEDDSSRRRGGDRPRFQPAPLVHDDIFTKPYEPSPSALKADELNREPERKSPKRQVAALLGGLPRKTEG